MDKPEKTKTDLMRNEIGTRTNEIEQLVTGLPDCCQPLLLNWCRHKNGPDQAEKKMANAEIYGRIEKEDQE